MSEGETKKVSATINNVSEVDTTSSPPNTRPKGNPNYRKKSFERQGNKERNTNPKPRKDSNRNKYNKNNNNNNIVGNSSGDNISSNNNNNSNNNYNNNSNNISTSNDNGSDSSNVKKDNDKYKGDNQRKGSRDYQRSKRHDSGRSEVKANTKGPRSRPPRSSSPTQSTANKPKSSKHIPERSTAPNIVNSKANSNSIVIPRLSTTPLTTDGKKQPIKSYNAVLAEQPPPKVVPARVPREAKQIYVPAGKRGEKKVIFHMVVELDKNDASITASIEIHEGDDPQIIGRKFGKDYELGTDKSAALCLLLEKEMRSRSTNKC